MIFLPDNSKKGVGQAPARLSQQPQIRTYFEEFEEEKGGVVALQVAANPWGDRPVEQPEQAEKMTLPKHFHPVEQRTISL